MNTVVKQNVQTHKLCFNALHWQALALFINRKDARPHISGINISAKHLTATNGHVLLSIEHGHNFDDFMPEDGITVEACKVGVKKVEGNQPTITLTLTKSGFEHYSVEATTNNAKGVTQSLEICQGNFPDYERIFPSFAENEAFRNEAFSYTNCLDAKYLELIGKAGVLLQKGEGANSWPMNIKGLDDQAMLVSFSFLPIAKALIMPLRS